MNTKNLLGGILIVLGVISLGYNGITYTQRKTVMQVGSLKASANEEHTIPLPPALGFAMLAGGVVVLALGRRNGNS